MSPSIKFTYFDGRGIAEPARLILRYANVPFEDIRITHETWPALKPKTKTGKVPFLEVDGHTLVESSAIHRFLARRYGLAGKDEYEQAEVDGWADVQKDFYNAAAPWFYPHLGFGPGDAVAAKQNDLLPSVARFFPMYVKAIKESGSGFLVRSGLTWADFAVSEYLIYLQHEAPEVFHDYPELLEYVKRIKAVPQLKEYYASRKE